MKVKKLEAKLSYIDFKDLCERKGWNMLTASEAVEEGLNTWTAGEVITRTYGEADIAPQVYQGAVIYENVNFLYPCAVVKLDVPKRSTQVGGNHYSKHSIQPFDIIDEYGLDFYEGNALKYLLRHKDKNGIEDIDKAIDYLHKIKEIQYEN